MRGMIFKAAPSITKEEILQNCEYRDIPDYGDVMTYSEFMSAVDNYRITNYDGRGCLILFDKVVCDTGTWIADKTVYFVDKFFIPFNVLHSIFGEDMKFIWFNK